MNTDQLKTIFLDPSTPEAIRANQRLTPEQRAKARAAREALEKNLQPYSATSPERKGR
jgi:hypothetical protein